MEANSYKKMVQEEESRRKEAGFTIAPQNNTVVTEQPMQDHKFEQTFYKQESYEPRKFLWFKINKKVGEQIIPIGLCATCHKLEIEHTQ